MVNAIASSVHDAQLHGKMLTSWRELGVHSYVKVSVITVLLSYLFHNDIANLVHTWQTDGSWSHGFIIPLFSLHFINQRKHDILNLKSRPSYIGLLLLVSVIIFYPLNIVHFQYGYFRPLCLISAVGAIVLFVGGWPLLRYTWLPIGFLIFAVPIPQRYYVLFTMPMRKLAATIATALLNFVSGMEATVNGVVIDVVYKGKVLDPALNVAEACSGMRLLMAFVALGVAMAYLHYRPAWQRMVLLASTVPIAIFCNVIRVTVTGFIYILIHPKYASGIYHDLLGIAMLPLAFGLYGCLAWFMASLFVDETCIAKEDVVVRNETSSHE